MPGLCRPICEGGFGFDYRMTMAIPNIWINLLKDVPDENWDMGSIVWTLTYRRYKEKHVAYAECHDQSIVGDLSLFPRMVGSDIFSHMGINDPYSTFVDRGIALHKMIRLITHSLGGEGYLNFIGNEFGHPDWLDFPREGNDDSYYYARRCWSLVEDKTLRYQFLNTFDRSLNHLEMQYGWLNSEKAFINRIHEPDKVIAYERAGLLFLFNFHPVNSYNDYKVGAERNGTYKIILDTDNEKYGGHNLVNRSLEYRTSQGNWDNRSNSLQIFLPSRVGIILSFDEELTNKETQCS